MPCPNRGHTPRGGATTRPEPKARRRQPTACSEHSFTLMRSKRARADAVRWHADGLKAQGPPRHRRKFCRRQGAAPPRCFFRAGRGQARRGLRAGLRPDQAHCTPREGPALALRKACTEGSRARARLVVATRRRAGTAHYTHLNVELEGRAVQQGHLGEHGLGAAGALGGRLRRGSGGRAVGGRLPALGVLRHDGQLHLQQAEEDAGVRFGQGKGPEFEARLPPRTPSRSWSRSWSRDGTRCGGCAAAVGSVAVIQSALARDVTGVMSLEQRQGSQHAALPRGRARELQLHREAGLAAATPVGIAKSEIFFRKKWKLF